MEVGSQPVTEPGIDRWSRQKLPQFVDLHPSPIFQVERLARDAEAEDSEA